MNIFKKILIHTVILLVIIFPVIIYADQTVDSTININNPFKAGDTLPELITTILNNVVMPVAAVAVVMWIIWAGFTYVLAQGKPAEIQKAHQRLLWSLIGAGILLGAAGISVVVQKTIEALTN